MGLTVNNTNVVEEVDNRTPAEIIAEIEELDAQAAQALQAIRVAVMWKTVKLGEICNVRRGTTITKKNTVDGAVPVIGGGTKPTYFHNEANRNAGCITVSGSGSAGL